MVIDDIITNFDINLQMGGESVNELDNTVVFNEEVYNFLKSRVLKLGGVVKDLIEVISKNSGIHKAEIIAEIGYSDTTIRPALFGLYSAGFIDLNKRGNLDIYYINENSKRLLKELNEMK